MYIVDFYDINNKLLASAEPLTISFTSKLNQTGEARIGLSQIIKRKKEVQTRYNEQILNLNPAKPKRVSICFQNNGEKKEVWNGWTINAQENIQSKSVKIACVDILGFLRYKRIDKDIDDQNVTIRTLLTKAWDNIKARKGNNLTLESDMTQIIDGQIFKGGQDFFSIVKKTALELGGEIELVSPNTIKIVNEIGRDLTGTNGKQLYFNYLDPDRANIDIQSTITLQGNNVTNFAITKNFSDNYIQESDVGDGEEEMGLFIINNDKGAVSANQQLVNYIEEHKAPKLSINLVPKANSFLPGELKIGDKVRINITLDNPNYEFKGETRITEIGVDNKSPFISKLAISEFTPIQKASDSLLEDLEELKINL